MLIVFTSYHTYLIYSNSTTAESAKLSEHNSYFSKKKKLLEWVKEDVEEVKTMFTEKELSPYAIDISKLTDNDYVLEGLKKCDTSLEKLKTFPYHKQKLLKTLLDIFYR